MLEKDNQQRPNILFVFSDQHRHDWVGYREECPVRTPTLDRLVNRGTAFSNAVCPSPLCGPSRACLASGHEYDTSFVRDHEADYPLTAPTMYGRLRNSGYHVMGTGKFDIQKHSTVQGIDGTNNLSANGFSEGINNAGKWDGYGKGIDGTPADPYTRYLADEGFLRTHIEDFKRRRNKDLSYHEGIDVHATFPTPLPERAYCDNFVGRQTIDLLKGAPKNQPWFMQVNFVGPHNPWDVTEEMHDWYRNPDVEFPEPIDPDERFSTEKHQEIRRNYAAMVESIDRWTGRFLDIINERGESGETIVIFAADHGEMLGDRGYWYKRTPYQPSAGVPFIVAGHDIADRGLVDVPATVLDVHATALDYAGLAPKDLDPRMDSQSMRPYLTGKADTDTSPEEGGPREVVYSGFGNWRFAFDGRYKLIRGFDPAVSLHETNPWDEASVRNSLRTEDPLLFDLKEDPKESVDVSADQSEVVDRLDAALANLRPV